MPGTVAEHGIGTDGRDGPSSRRRTRTRRGAAMLLMLAATFVTSGFVQADSSFRIASAHARVRLVQPTAKPSAEATADVPPDRLWKAQPGLQDQAIAALRPRVPGHANIYALGVAAGGGQQLFARETRLALQVAARRFGADDRSDVLLSNGAADLFQTPLATQESVAAALRAIGTRIDPAHDVVFVYLASHGSPDADLATDLPDHQRLTSISADSLAAALTRSGVRRRVIVVSACFAGTWIPALASDDTIVVTAARRDRTSFGCDDTRRLTYFGQAFLTGPLEHGASLHDAFLSARRTVARWEAADNGTPSEPQAFVGRHMQALWTERAPARKAR